MLRYVASLRLELLYENDFLSQAEFESIYSTTEEVMKLIRSSIMTKKAKLGLLSISIGIILVGILSYTFG